MEFFITVLALSFVVFVHELGHFLAAKKVGVRVYEFSIGMGPKLFSKKKEHTEYSLRLLPIGGFVKLAGLDDEEKEISDAINYRKKSLKARALIISAGSIMNLLLGFLIFFILFFSFGTYKVTATIDAVLAQSPAQKVGLMKGDEIIQVNNKFVENVIPDVIKQIANSKGEHISLTVLSQGYERQVVVLPEKKSDQDTYRIGISLKTISEDVGFLDSLLLSAKATGLHVQMVFKSLEMLISGDAKFKDMTGPVGIVQFASFSLKKSTISFFEIMALITISLGVINMFPFPVLDGGHMLFLLIEFIRRKPVSKRMEMMVQGIGIAILIGLSILILFNDLFFWDDRTELLEAL